jgi:hypothetical protein
LSTTLTPKERYQAFARIQNQIWDFNTRLVDSVSNLDDISIEDAKALGYPELDWSAFNDDLFTKFISAWTVSNEHAVVTSSILANLALDELENTEVKEQYHVNVAAMALMIHFASGSRDTFYDGLDVAAKFSVSALMYHLEPTELFRDVSSVMDTASGIAELVSEPMHVIHHLASTIRRQASQAMQDDEFLACIEIDAEDFYSEFFG